MDVWADDSLYEPPALIEVGAFADLVRGSGPKNEDVSSKGYPY